MTDFLDFLLAPFARLMVARGRLFGDVSERLKQHYVQAATVAAQPKATDSKISVLTGLQRRDVARLREAPVATPPPNPMAHLVSIWLSHPDYSGPHGAATIPRFGDAKSFETLARMVRSDIHPRTLLDPLIETGTVAFDAEHGSVRLLKTYFQPLAGSEDQLTYLGANVGDHLSVATANVTAQGAPGFERAVHYDNLTEAQIAELAELHADLQMQVFERLNSTAAGMKTQAQGTVPGTHRFRAGAFFYATQKEGDAE